MRYFFTIFRIIFILSVISLNIIYLSYLAIYHTEKISILHIFILLITAFTISRVIFDFPHSKGKTMIFYEAGKKYQLFVGKGKSEYTFSITDISLCKEKKQNINIEAKKIIVITGEIININHEIISLTNNNFFIYDKSGNRLIPCPLFPKKDYNIQIPMGRNSTFQYTYALNDESNNIEIEYFPDATWKKPAGIWKVTVTS